MYDYLEWSCDVWNISFISCGFSHLDISYIKKDIFIIWIDDGVNVHLAFGFCWNRRINLVLTERSLLIYCNENVNSRYVSIISPWGSKICTSSKFNYWNAVLLTDYLSKWTLVYNRFHFGISRLKFRIIHLCHICSITKSVLAIWKMKYYISYCLI